MLRLMCFPGLGFSWGLAVSPFLAQGADSTAFDSPGGGEARTPAAVASRGSDSVPSLEVTPTKPNVLETARPGVKISGYAEASGARTSGSPVTAPFPVNTGNQVSTGTATLNVRAWEGMLVRPEIRYDHSTIAEAFGDKSDQVTFWIERSLHLLVLDVRAPSIAFISRGARHALDALTVVHKPVHWPQCTLI